MTCSVVVKQIDSFATLQSLLRTHMKSDNITGQLHSCGCYIMNDPEIIAQKKILK